MVLIGLILSADLKILMFSAAFGLFPATFRWLFGGSFGGGGVAVLGVGWWWKVEDEVGVYF